MHIHLLIFFLSNPQLPEPSLLPSHLPLECFQNQQQRETNKNKLPHFVNEKKNPTCKPSECIQFFFYVCHTNPHFISFYLPSPPLTVLQPSRFECDRNRNHKNNGILSPPPTILKTKSPKHHRQTQNIAFIFLFYLFVHNTGSVWLCIHVSIIC